MSSVKERLKQFIKHQGLTVKAFEKSIGAGNAYVNSIVNTIGAKYLNIILELYPTINREWLLYGEGQMLKNSDSSVEFLGTAHHVISEETIPVRLFEVTPSATFQEFCGGASEAPSTTNIVPAPGEILDESYCVFQVRGESMAPQIQPRARVLCQEVPPTKWHTLFDCVVVIAYADKFVIKRIATNHLQAEDYLVLASDNPDYPQRETVQLADIRAIFRAKRIISSEIV